jgi:hypothetical protein
MAYSFSGTIFDSELRSLNNMIKVLSFLSLALVSFAQPHPLHVSVTEINYDEKDRALEIMVRIFVDDLETTLRKRENLPELDILNPKGKTLDQMMRAYLEHSLAVSLDGKRQALNYLGAERDGEAFIFYVEIPKVRKWRKVSVFNSILTEVFDDQSNLVHVSSSSAVKSLRLNKGNPSGELSFED